MAVAVAAILRCLRSHVAMPVRSAVLAPCTTSRRNDSVIVISKVLLVTQSQEGEHMALQRSCLE